MAPACPVEQCSDLPADALPGVFWFAADSGLSAPFKARCTTFDDSADPAAPWIQVITLNHEPSWSLPDDSFDSVASAWSAPCEEYTVGTGAKAQGEWDSSTGFADPGINPAACTQQVRAVRICPHNLGEGSFPCYETGLLSPGDAPPSLRTIWTGALSMSLPTLSGSWPGGGGDFVADFCDADGSGSELHDIDWSVGASWETARVGFSFAASSTGKTYYFGAGLPASVWDCPGCGHSGLTASASPLSGSGFEHCRGALDVWVR